MFLVIISFCIFLLLFVIIGVLSTLKHQKTTNDYLLATHSISPLAVALSAIATNNSAYMFIGMIGYTYLVGISSIWLMIGWIGGDFIASFFVHKRLRITTEKRKSLTYVEVLSKWGEQELSIIRFVGAIITLLFLGTYAAAQLKAGSKALHVIFGWNYAVGSIIGGVIVLAYCIASGIRATIWTDVAQGIVMMFAMAILLFVSIEAIGGFTNFYQNLFAIAPHYMSLFPQNILFNNWLGIVLFIMSWMFAGFGVIGQPHIMTRFMTLDTPQSMTKTRIYYYCWYVIFFSLTIAMGLVARLLLPHIQAFDAELALPSLALKMLPDVLTGLILAGLFAALMSTADSQMLACAASLTRDILPKKQVGYWMTKLATAFVMLVALIIALFGHESVFQLVLVAWSTLGASFGPLLLLYCIKQKIPQWLAVTMMLSAVSVILIWRFVELNEAIYEIMPAMMVSFALFFIYKIYQRVS